MAIKSCQLTGISAVNSISCSTRGPNILDHCCTTIKDAYHSIPCPHVRKSDHNAVFLLPAYKQKLKREDPSQKEVLHWSEALEDDLRDCLDSVDWTVFKCSAENLDEYATTITDFISKCVEDCIPTKSIPMFPIHKPWISQEMHSLPKTRCAAFKSDDPDQHRKSRNDLCKAIREAKKQYWTKLEAQTYQTDFRHLWQGLNNITQYKMKQSKIADKDTPLPKELTAFYAQFEQNASGMVMHGATALDTPVPSVTTGDIRSVFLGVNPRKATWCPSLSTQILSTMDDISLAQHSSLEHLNNKDTYIRLLLIVYSSTFNTIILSRLIKNSVTL
eukprot:g24321.t1